MTTWRLDKVTI